ncbi:MAG: Mu transposase C-terminal domain-containing protein [Dehalococcoidia bacterium]|nr:Mu transposase C-terminal domain-containing protein [Dehalococcoidia bacterium]
MSKTQPPPAEKDRPALAELTEAALQRALERFHLLRPCLEEGVPLATIARSHGLEIRTARRWVKRYKEFGLVGLTHRPRGDRNRRRIPPELEQLIEGFALRKPPPTASFVHRQVSQVAAQHGWQTPSYSRVYDIIRRLDPALVTLAHDGSKVYGEEFDLLYRREASRPNDIWQADHTPLDIWLLNEQGAPARPWVTTIIDDYSRAIAGYYLSFQAPCTLHTSLALRQAVWRKEDPRWHICGIPAAFYTDHGSDFTSQHLEQVAADLKMVLVFSTVGRPRGRGRIERFFETVNQLFLCRLPGYSPAGSPRGTPTLTLPAFENKFREFLLGEYHQRAHGGTGIAPMVRWEAGGFLPQLPESLEQLDLLLIMVAKPRRIHQDGIHFQGLRYLDLTLAEYVGEDVTIRYDPRDLAEIRVYHQNAFLCRAVCQELAGQIIGLKEIVQARNERRRQLRGQLTEHAAVVAQLLAVHRAQTQSSEPKPAPPAEASRLKRYENE